MKKVLILTSGVLPVIKHKGGAVESLVKSYLDFNEINKKFEFTIYSIIGDNADNYKNVKMPIIDNCNIIYKLSRICRYFINNKLPYIYVGNAYLNEVIKKIKKIKKNMILF